MTDRSAAAPAPEPVRFFGTTWVDRGAAYRLRRVAFTVGALLALVVGAVLMWLAVTALGDSQGLVGALLVVAVLGCSVMAGLRTWRTLVVGRSGLTGWMADDRALTPIMAVGFVGTLAAYAVRSLVEAPGEGLARSRHQAALDRRRTSGRRRGR
ncbi:hypothetical protein [Peterkaempfera griseoplana]|uniref:hypothetical protein n=1 Tax=Peterkaempfera griseoplana TaxID=66896 RepID=UPI0006E24EA3|nr:hypothetical protein [Peterkaempfera griseoplana]